MNEIIHWQIIVIKKRIGDCIKIFVFQKLRETVKIQLAECMNNNMHR